MPVEQLILHYPNCWGKLVLICFRGLVFCVLVCFLFSTWKHVSRLSRNNTEMLSALLPQLIHKAASSRHQQRQVFFVLCLELSSACTFLLQKDKCSIRIHSSSYHILLCLVLTGPCWKQNSRIPSLVTGIDLINAVVTHLFLRAELVEPPYERCWKKSEGHH